MFFSQGWYQKKIFDCRNEVEYSSNNERGMVLSVSDFLRPIALLTFLRRASLLTVVAAEICLLTAVRPAVADTYDAITSKRPYSQAMTPEEALTEIGQHSGSQFDPKVVKAFEKVIRRIIQDEGMSAPTRVSTQI